MSWEFAPPFDAGHRAALKTGKNLVYVCPPAWWATLPLIAHLNAVARSGLSNLILTTHAMGVVEGAAVLRSSDSLRTVHAATGLSRTAHLLHAQRTTTLVSTPSDVLQLLARSSLDLGGVERVVLGWPELLLHEGLADELDNILAELRSAQRVIVTSDDSAIRDFLERHARRTPLVVASRPPAAPTVSTRYAVTHFAGLPAAVRAALDTVNPNSALIWDPTVDSTGGWQEFAGDPAITIARNPGEQSVDLAIATQLPSVEALAALSAVAEEVLNLIRAPQLPYLKSITARVRPFRLPSAVDRARDRAARLRNDVRRLIDEDDMLDAILTLAPLFDVYDPATVAAALAVRSYHAERSPVSGPAFPAWVHLHINVGRHDRVGPGDIVGAILNTVGVSKTQIGKVDSRDRFSLIEVRTEIAEQVLRGLDGLVLRGKKVAARIDHR